MKNYHYLIGIAAIIIGVYFFSNSNKTTSSTSNGVFDSSLKTFNLTIQDFTYLPESIDVDLNDSVTLKITNKDNVTHGINLPAFNVQEFISPGQTQVINFIANQQDDPELFCSSDHGEKLLINVN